LDSVNNPLFGITTLLFSNYRDLFWIIAELSFAVVKVSCGFLLFVFFRHQLNMAHVFAVARPRLRELFFWRIIFPC